MRIFGRCYAIFLYVIISPVVDAMRKRGCESGAAPLIVVVRVGRARCDGYVRQPGERLAVRIPQQDLLQQIEFALGGIKRETCPPADALVGAPG
jgi:hypothetical protein